MAWQGLAALVALLGAPCGAFLLPGTTPTDYQPGGRVDVKVNSLRSIHTQMNLDFYSLPYCRPETVEVDIDNLGEFITGERLHNSAYLAFMLENVACRPLCVRTITERSFERVKMAIDDGYHHQWVVDNLPPIADIRADDGEIISTVHGFPVGYLESTGDYVLYNHISITLMYHEFREGIFRVVGFRVSPMSVEHSFTDGSLFNAASPPLDTCPQDRKLDFVSVRKPQRLSVGGKVLFSYDVEWLPSEVTWASRYDVYLHAASGNLPDAVHWFSITNSLAVALALSAVIAFILIRALRRDISKIREEQFLESGLIGTDEDQRLWRLLAKDVFRPPKANKLMLCVVVGTGSQMLLSIFATIVFAFIGFLSPQSRGSVLVGIVLLYALSGMLSGFVSARLYKTFRGTQWRRCSFAVATFFPGLMILLFAALETIVVMHQRPAPALPFVATAMLIATWLFVYVPLCFAGSYLGYQKPPFEFPQSTNRIARAIPEQPFLLKPHVAYAILGILPFAACFIELFFIMSSVWLGQTYYVFGFLLLVTTLMLLMCAEGAIVLTYFSLCAEDYRWWWRSFLGPATVGLYVLAYSVFYFQRLQVHNWATYVLYFGYMLMGCTAVSIMAGTSGFLACLWFVRFIYGAIKAD